MKGGLSGYQEQEEELKKQRDIKLLKRFIPLIKQNRKVIGISIALMVMLSLAELTIPFITKTAVDEYILPGMAADLAQADREQYLFYSAVSGVVLFILSIFLFILNFFKPLLWNMPVNA